MRVGEWACSGAAAAISLPGRRGRFSVLDRCEARKKGRGKKAERKEGELPLLKRVLAQTRAPPRRRESPAAVAAAVDPERKGGGYSGIPLGFRGSWRPAGFCAAAIGAQPSDSIRRSGRGRRPSRPEAAQEGAPRGPFRRPGRRLLGRGPRRGVAAVRKRAVGRFPSRAA